MEKKLPNSTKVVVIGGGVVGCSVAYHLAKFGWKDTILLERDQLTSGTTWHAAGLVSQLGPSAAITKIRKYTLDLYKELEKEVDHSAGLRLNGALSIAQNKGRWQELQRQATTAQLYDVDVKILDKDQIKKDYPIINTDEVIGGILMPGDGAADPSGVTHMLAKAARKEGAQIFEKTPVEEILTKNGKISGVKVNEDQDVQKMVDLWAPYADIIAFTNYTPWESSYENPINDVSIPCTELWRRLFVWWDGKVNPCDYDYKSILTVGNATETSISNLWNSDKYSELRNSHLTSQRSSKSPCNKCPMT